MAGPISAKIPNKFASTHKIRLAAKSHSALDGSVEKNIWYDNFAQVEGQML
jgi:hypothetical protein